MCLVGVDHFPGLSKGRNKGSENGNPEPGTIDDTQTWKLKMNAHQFRRYCTVARLVVYRYRQTYKHEPA